jgi:hypothetical protein
LLPAGCRHSRRQLAGGPGGGASSTSNAIRAWVSSTFTSTTVDGVTIHDLTAPV